MTSTNPHFSNIIFKIRGSVEKDVSIFPELSNIDFYKNITTLNTIKSKFDEIGEKEWDYLKKKSNPFECVTTNGGLANYTPTSRAYYKMLEIIQIFKPEIQKLSEPFTTLHLAEGPGGFMECINNVLQDINYKNYKIYGMTLIKEEK